MAASQEQREALKPITAFFGTSDDDRRKYEDAISDACGGIALHELRAISVEVSKEMFPGRKPVPAQFFRARAKLAEELGWRKNTNQSCGACNGERFVVAYFRWPGDTAIVSDGVKPCPACNRDRIDPTKGVYEVSRDQFEALGGKTSRPWPDPVAEAASFTPAQARAALAFHKQFETHPAAQGVKTQQMVRVLREIAGVQSDPKNLASEDSPE